MGLHTKGRVGISQQADWGGRSAAIIKALELPYTAGPAGSEGALVAELKSAWDRKAPLVMAFWSPHWVLNEVDVGWVVLPTPEPACDRDASWGPNPNATGDWGIETALTFKLAWKGMADKWPGAYKFLKKFQFDDEDQIPMIFAINVRGEDLVDVTTKWVNENEQKWRRSVEKALAER